MRYLAILSAVALALPGRVIAQPPGSHHMRASFDRCVDASGGITVNILDCIGAEYDFQDGILNARYKAVTARLNLRQRAALRVSQRRWLRQREPECMKVVGEEAGGTLGDIIRNQCMLSTLVERIDWLDKYRP